MVYTESTGAGPDERQAQMTSTVSQGRSSYETPQPQIEVRFPAGSYHRVVKASLYRLAAEIETATAAREHWNVEIEVFGDTWGRVYLELSKGDAAEVERAMAFLHHLARLSEELNP